MLDSPASQLNLWKKRLEVVPDWVWERTEVESLVLADNGLSSVSDRIGRLRRLRMLDLGHNQLTCVPDALADLDGLTDFLYLHDNRLTSLPASLSRMTKLRYLNVSENEFDALPECICAMGSLIELRATDNRLASLPDSIGQLTRLRELHLRNNQLTLLPESMATLTELRQIDVRGNPLMKLPTALAGLPRLEKLDLRWVETLAPPDWLGSLESRRLRGVPLTRRIAWVIASLFFMGAGVMHLRHPEPFVKIVPPFVPWPLVMVYVSGVAEIAGGLGLLFLRFRRAAAWGLVALLVAVFPANLYMAMEDVQVTATPLPGWVLWARLPLQPVLIWWVLWCSRPAATGSAGAPRFRA